MNNAFLKLIAACLIHLCIGSVYAWSTLVIPIEQATGWSKSYITFAFSIIILCLSIAAYSARITCSKLNLSTSCVGASFLFGLSFLGMGYAIHLNFLPLFYIFAIGAGFAVGTCYILPVDMVMQWFPKHKGLSGGSCIMAFGFGSAIASPLFNYLAQYSPTMALEIVGASYMIIMIISSWVLSLPKTTDNSNGVVYYDESKFRKLFLAFYINIACGISLLSLASPILQSLGASITFATFVVSIIGIANGLGRILWATVSDYIGRNNTYQIFFSLQALLFILLATIQNIYIFTAILFLLITMYGGGFAVMPAYVADAFSNPIKDKQKPSTVVRIYGKVLLAWGIAGITAPMFLTYIYEHIGANVAFLIFGIIFLIGFFVRRKYPVVS